MSHNDKRDVIRKRNSSINTFLLDFRTYLADKERTRKIDNVCHTRTYVYCTYVWWHPCTMLDTNVYSDTCVLNTCMHLVTCNRSKFLYKCVNLHVHGVCNITVLHINSELEIRIRNWSAIN